MRAIHIIGLLLLLGACAAPRSYTRPTPLPLTDAFSCALEQMEEMEAGLRASGNGSARCTRPTWISTRLKSSYAMVMPPSRLP